MSGTRGGYRGHGRALGTPNTPPTASITSPSGGASYTDAETVELRGTGSDAEDGALTGTSLAWSSNLDGALGTGTAVDTTLSVGSHTITLTATDSEGATATDTVAVTVTAAPVTLVLDNFVDTNGTLIGSHTPDTDSVGGGWANNGGAASDIQGNRLSIGFGAVPLIDAGASDAEAIFECPASGIDCIVRAQDANNYIRIRTTASAIFLARVVGGSATGIGSKSWGSLPYPITLRVDCNGTSIVATVDGQAGSATATESTFQSETHYGATQVSELESIEVIG